jgi:predicted dehydrogenase
MSATAAQLGPRFRVLGSEAAYTVSGMDGQEKALRAGRTPKDAGWGQAPPEAYGRLGTPAADRPEPTDPGAYQDFYTEVARALRGGAPPPVSLDDAITGLEIIESAMGQAAEPAPDR